MIDYIDYRLTFILTFSLFDLPKIASLRRGSTAGCRSPALALHFFPISEYPTISSTLNNFLNKLLAKALMLEEVDFTVVRYSLLRIIPFPMSTLLSVLANWNFNCSTSSFSFPFSPEIEYRNYLS